MGLFEKLAQGLTKTKQDFDQKVNAVFANFRKVDQELLDELEEGLILADMGYKTVEQIMGKLRHAIKIDNISESQDVKVKLKEIISDLLNENKTNNFKPPAILFVIGVNGVGKTTSAGKLAYHLKDKGYRTLLVAADTFRAAASEQLSIWAQRTNCNIVKQKEGADPAAVVYDGISKAIANDIDVVVVDTAGRLHNKKNLMDELKKILKVADTLAPNYQKEVLLVLDSTTGQNAINQANEFMQVSDITGIILTKLDGSAKGGVVIGISCENKIPIKYIGVGEKAEDLQEFISTDFAHALLD